MGEAFEVGTKVGARWYSTWYIAVVTARHGLFYEVRYGDGTSGRVAPHDVVPVAPKKLEPGARVIACWNDGARMFHGAVKELAGDEVLVAWDDGAKPTHVPLDRICREPASHAPTSPDAKPAFPVGASVAAQWNQAWYLATIIDFEAGVHHVLYWDASNGRVAAEQIRPLAERAKLVAGRRVLASWNKQPQLYGGGVVETTAIGAIVRWDDGTPPSEVAAERIAIDDV